MEYQIIESKEEDIYKFGIECLRLKIITLGVCAIIALLLKKMIEFIILLLAFILIRRSAGGYHAKTKQGCILFSCCSVLVSLLLCEVHFTLSFYVLTLIVIDIGLAFIAPVDNKNNRFNDAEKDFFKKKTCRTLLIINTVCACLMYYNIKIVYIPLISGIIMSFFFVVIGKVQGNEYSNL